MMILFILYKQIPKLFYYIIFNLIRADSIFKLEKKIEKICSTP